MIYPAHDLPGSWTRLGQGQQGQGRPIAALVSRHSPRRIEIEKTPDKPEYRLAG
jgi:hypothetical protein